MLAHFVRSRGVFAALALGIATAASAQTTIYSTGFEAPTFSTTGTGPAPIPQSLGGGTFTGPAGSIYYANTQGDFWAPVSTSVNLATYQAAVSSSIVQSGSVQSGSQALSISGAVANQRIFGTGKPLSTATGGVWELEFGLRVTNPGSPDFGQWGMGIYDSTTGDNLAILGFTGGFLGVASGPTVSYSPLNGYFSSVSYGSWNTYRLRVDFNANTMSVALNGADITSFQNLPMRTDVARSGVVPDLLIGGQAPNGSSYSSTPEVAYFDNVKVTAAPEPGALSLLALGGVLAVGLRRRSRTR